MDCSKGNDMTYYISEYNRVNGSHGDGGRDGGGGGG
jgi:hypothetical protein